MLLSSKTVFSECRPKPQQQSYTQAFVMGCLIGGLNGYSCLLIEKQLPLWWPFNCIAARLSSSVILYSLTYAYLAFTEQHGVTCHCSTLQSSAIITDWATYLTAKNL